MDFINILESTHNIKLNEEQLKAVTHVYGPALVLSGPGSGKTTVIASRCAYLIMGAGINPRNILTLTFNRAAKLEMESRFSRIYTDGLKPGFGTIHSFCNMIVGDYERRQGKRFKRIEGEEEDKRKIIKNIYTRINGININEDELEDLINEIGLVKNRMIKDLDNIESSIKNFTEVFKFYEEYKKSNLLIDFDDMLTYAYSILNKCPDLLLSYRNRYTFLQVDEGQDLSKIQFEILKLLAGNEKSNIFIVADDDQSIYGFRGATPGHIFDFEKEFTGLRILKLENNYRSSGNIVEISSDFIRTNQKRYDKCHKTVNSFFDDPFILDFINMKEQLKFIIETIKSHLEENSNIEIAILYRNNISSVLIADAIDKAGINIKIKQNKLFFFKHWIVQDILAFLRFSQNQADNEAFFRIYNKMNRFISRQMAENAINHESSKSIIDSIIETSDLKPFQITKFIELKNEFSMFASLNPEAALRYIEESFKYFEGIKEYCESSKLSFDNLYGLFKILKIIAENCTDIQSFLNRLQQLESLFDEKTHVRHKRSITMTTLHSSKGLEFDCVFMVDLANSEIPGKKALEASKREKDDSILEEERRLFYVGMTRAKRYLYLLNHDSKKSIFIDEVNDCIIRRIKDGLGEGVMAFHKKYGIGAIVSIHEDIKGRLILDIDFGGIVRKLDFDVCIDKGLLSF